MEEDLKETAEEVEEEEVPLQEEPLQLSLSALNGISTLYTMRVTGKIRKNPLHFLIDFGSTHNFLDLSTAKKLHCDIKKSLLYR